MRTLILMLLLATTVQAQYITTYDSRHTQPVASPYLAVDVGNTDPIVNPDYRDYNRKIQLRSVGVPALFDVELGAGVTITGTVAQAQAALSNLVSVATPGKARRKGKIRKDEITSVTTNINKANGWSAGRAELVRLAELIEALQEDVEEIKRKQEAVP